jgi:hypothetical protein
VLLKQRCVSERDDGTTMRRMRRTVSVTEAVQSPVAYDRRVQFLIDAADLARKRAADSQGGVSKRGGARGLATGTGGTVTSLTIRRRASRTPSLPSGRDAITMSGSSLTVRRDARTQRGRNDGGTI